MRGHELRSILHDHATGRITTEEAARALAALQRAWGCLTLQLGTVSTPAERRLIERFRELADGR